MLDLRDFGAPQPGDGRPRAPDGVRAGRDRRARARRARPRTGWTCARARPSLIVPDEPTRHAAACRATGPTPTGTLKVSARSAWIGRAWLGRAELREPARHVAVAEEQQQPERRPAHHHAGGGQRSRPAGGDQHRVDGRAEREQRGPGERELADRPPRPAGSCAQPGSASGTAPRSGSRAAGAGSAPSPRTRRPARRVEHARDEVALGLAGAQRDEHGQAGAEQRRRSR